MLPEGVENTLDQTNGSVGMVVATSAPPYFNGYIRWNIDGREHVRPDQRVGYETTKCMSEPSNGDSCLADQTRDQWAPYATFWKTGRRCTRWLIHLPID